MFTAIVVGRGLFGTATAKHLQRSLKGRRVLAVGPAAFDPDHKVYSSHDDQGRVVRLLGFDDYWTDLNVEAAAGFRDLEAETGVAVVHRTGCVTTCEIPYERSAYFREGRVQRTASRVGLDVEVAKTPVASSQLLRQKGFAAPHPKTGGRVANACYEAGATGAGFLSVPNLKRAQELSFVSHGGAVSNQTALSLARREDCTWQVHLSDGSVVSAQSVVVACGSFCNKLLPRGLPALPLHLKTETVLLAKLPGDLARELAASMPSLLLEVDTGEYEGVYAVPPMQYPDGSWYLKIGCNSPEDQHFAAASATGVKQGESDGDGPDGRMWSEISHWFEGSGDAAGASATRHQEQTLKRVFRDVYPDLYGRVSLFAPKRCIITRTPTGRPILAELATGLFVATGGNGYGAMAWPDTS